MTAFNEWRLDWINKQLPGTYTNIMDAMQAFAENQGFANWASIGGKNADEAPLVIEGNSGVAESGATVAVGFDQNVSAGAGQEHNGWEVWANETNIGVASGTINAAELRLTIEGHVIKKDDRPITVRYDASKGALKGPTGLNVTTIFAQDVPNGSQQSG